MREEAKVALLERLERMARSRDPRVTQVMASLAGEYEAILVARSDGLVAADVRPLVRVSLSVIVEENGRREQGYAGGGGRFDYGYFTDAVLVDYAAKAVAQALLNLDARPAPAGTMTVVLGHGWPGILLHEAIGHGLEGDFNRKGTSAFSGRVGERVAAKGITVIDDGTLPQRRGSLNIDDEGNPTQRTVLIEDGILKGYMQDVLNARLMGVAPTGNGRRESFAHLPMPRMTNTIMLAGDARSRARSSNRCRTASTRRISAAGRSTSRAASSCSPPRKPGRSRTASSPIRSRGATLIGNGPDALTRVSMVGNDLELDSGVGHLRQGRAERAGRRRAADAAHRRAHRRAERADAGAERLQVQGRRPLGAASERCALARARRGASRAASPTACAGRYSWRSRCRACCRR